MRTGLWLSVMAFILLHKAFWLLVLIGKASGSTSCKSWDTLPPTDGRACQPFNHRNISTANIYECSFACVPHSNCHATIYDVPRRVCILLGGNCFSLTPYHGHIYQAFRLACIKWIPQTSNHDVYWYWYNTQKKNVVARVVHGGDIVVGKELVWDNKAEFSAVASDGNRIRGGSYERLAVHPSCDVTWVSHDVSLGRPLPSEALIGGVLMATNTPLYVVKMYVDGCPSSGYFNPVNNRAWVEYFGAHSGKKFEVMVTKPR